MFDLNKKINWEMFVFVISVAVIVFAQVVYMEREIISLYADAKNQQLNAISLKDEVTLEKTVIPLNGIKIPIKWNDFGKQMIEKGVIDKGQMAMQWIITADINLLN